MSSEKEGLPNVAGSGGQEASREAILKALWESSAHDQEIRNATPISSSEAVGRFPFSLTAALAQSWITAHLPAAQIEAISALAAAVIGDRSQAAQWLSKPNIATDNRAPIELIGEKDGYERVQDLLLRIEYGVLA